MTREEGKAFSGPRGNRQPWEAKATPTKAKAYLRQRPDHRLSRGDRFPERCELVASYGRSP